MKLKNLLPILLLLISCSFYAQRGGFTKEKKEQIKAMKVAFLTQELALTPDEAEKFWPVYNAFDDKQFEIRHEKMKNFMKRMDESIDKMSDKEAVAFLSQMEGAEDEMYQLKKKFNASLKGILSPLKIIKLKKAEEDFNRKLLKQYRDKKK